MDKILDLHESPTENLNLNFILTDKMDQLAISSHI